jgi:hypothetical protein
MELHVKCDNGFVATIPTNMRKSELLNLHEWNGLTRPEWIRGSLYRWWSFCGLLVYFGIVQEK